MVRVPKQTRLVVESKVTLDTQGLPDKVVRAIERSCSHSDPLYAMRRAQGLSTEGLTRRIKTSERVGRRTLVVWRGALGRIVRLLKLYRVDFKIVDRRLRLPRIDLPCRVVLRDYQEHPCRVMLKRQQTIGQGPCGSGKTEMALHVISKLGQPTLVLVWQESQQKTWLERIRKYFDLEPGGLGGAFKTPRIEPITIGLAQSVRTRMDELRGRFGCVICDEVQRFAAPTLSEVVNNLPAAYRLGVSDDERRRDQREFLLYDTFGPKGWRLRADAGQCPVDVIVVPTDFTYSGGDYYPGEWASVVGELTTDEGRLALTKQLARMEVNDGSRVLIWSDRVDHCRRLQGDFNALGIKAGLLLGTPQMRKEKDRTKAGLEDGTIEVGIGTTVAEQSVNIPPLDVGIMTCASADKRLLRFKQMRGRLVRPFEGKTIARLYYLWDYKVPGLMRKVRNIKRRYAYKVLRLVKTKEQEMSEKVAVTVQTLKAGCKQLGIEAPKGATQKKLEKLIEKALAKDKTYGSYACGACFRDVPDDMDPCPWCQSKFKPFDDDEPAEADADTDGAEEAEDTDDGDGQTFYTTKKCKKAITWNDDGQPTNAKETNDDGYPVVYNDEGKPFFVDEDGDLMDPTADDSDDSDDEPEDTDDDGDDDAEDEDADDDTDDDAEDADDDDDDDGEADDDGEDSEDTDDDEDADEDADDEDGDEDSDDDEDSDEDDDEDDDEPEPEPKKGKKKGGRKPNPKTVAKKAEKEAKREQIKSELPYTEKQLSAMKRVTLIMVAGVLGIKDPISVGSTDKLVKVILKAQDKKGLTKKAEGKGDKKDKSKKVAKAGKKIKRK